MENVLVVGCGGLGVELLKMLTLDAKYKITVIDDDMIDLTNLNRQFLFTRKDINKSKSETIKKLSKNIVAIVDRINNYDITFFKQFDLVFNCLDNIEARSFVNERCYLLKIRMIDGGSGGWLGQSFINIKQCYDCIPKAVEMSYPVCTVKNKPNNFEHCLVWAKTVVDNGDKQSIIDEISENKENTKRFKYDSDSCELIDEPQDLGDYTVIENSKFIDLLKSPSFDLIYNLAVFKANRFNIQRLSYLNSQTFIKKIIPSICTTNSIVASLMILSAENLKNYYLVQGKSLILSLDCEPKKSDCNVCNIPNYICYFGKDNTVNDVIESFGGESMVSELQIYEKNSNVKLIDFENKFCIIIKNQLKYRFYFKLGDQDKIVHKRVR